MTVFAMFVHERLIAKDCGVVLWNGNVATDAKRFAILKAWILKYEATTLIEAARAYIRKNP